MRRAIALAAAIALIALALFGAPAAADGWRAGFLLAVAAPVGAVVLMLIGRIAGADWDAALRPLLPLVPWLALLAVPLVVDQALFHKPATHLLFWLSPAFFALRSAAALLFWSWLARALFRDRVTRPGPLLLAHGLVVSVMGYDWLIGVAPGQPESAAPMVLATMQIGGACAAACAAGLGTARIRRDLAYILIACALGLAYLLYMDFAIVWFGNLPGHVGWYADRYAVPAALLPGLAILLGLIAPILLVGIGWSDRARGLAGWSALAAIGLIAAWIVAGPAGWLALAAMAATALLAGALGREAMR